MESILTSIKKMLGITEEDESFDVDVITDINSAFSILAAIGVVSDGFRISDKNSKWNDSGIDDALLDMAKEYVYIKVKLLFDSPSSSFVMDSLNKQASECEWYLYTLAQNNAGGY